MESYLKMKVLISDIMNLRASTKKPSSTSASARTKSGSGQKRGVTNLLKTELSTLIHLIEEHKPCGAFQWDIVSTAMYYEYAQI